LACDPTNAERQRRYRMRQRGELCSAPVEMPYSVVTRLVELGYLQDASDPFARARAVEKIVQDFVMPLRPKHTP